MIKGIELFDYVLRKKKVVISAPDRGGKTALARTLFKDLWANGILPLFLSGEKLAGMNMKSLPSYLDECFKHQYAGPKVARYWSMAPEGRAVIIDDYHKLPSVRVQREKLLEQCYSRFGTIVLIGGPSLRFQELLAGEAEATVLSDFVHCDVLAFRKKHRSQLIRRWYMLNRTTDIADDLVDRQIAQMENVIGTVLGRDLLPSFPGYILLFLQQFELRKPVEVGAASYGKLYLAFMTLSLEKWHIDYETAVAYLGELAYAFFERKIDVFTDQEGLVWHLSYVARHKDPIEYATFRNSLVRAGLVSHKNGTLRFRVKAVFYFFVARHISGHLREEAMQGLVKTLSGKLHREDAANIILFLCHTDRVQVMGEVVAAAKSMFTDVPETDLYEDVKFTGDLVARLDIPVLTGDDPETRRQAMLEAADAATDEDPSDEMYAYQHEEETEDESETRRQVARMTGAWRTIQILGQIAKSFGGGLLGDEKRELAETCFGLSLRVLRFGFDVFRMSCAEFGEAIRRRAQRRNPELTDDAAVMVANQIVFMFVDMFTYAVVRHVATSIAVEKLAMTFSELREEKGTLAIRTLDAAVQLELSTHVPDKLLIDLYGDVKDVLLLQGVVRHLVFDRLYFFRCPPEVQSRLCSKVGIKMLPAAFNSDDKKH